MKKIFIATIFFLGWALSLYGQLATDEEIIDLLNYPIIQLDNPVIRNHSVISQVQEKNNLFISQEQKGTVSNIVFVSQHGFQNISLINQSGTSLETLLWQVDSNNEANLWSNGKEIKVIVKQSGDGNQINSYIENHGPQTRLAEFTQEGNFNKINLSLRGDGFTNSAPEQRMEINQYGNSHELNAFMEPFSAPLEINQTPGVNGEGMKIDVSTSTFSFPLRK
jgi:hypothetical protein